MWYTTMKSFEPMISAPLNCSERGRPSSIHSLPIGNRPLPTCSTNGAPRSASRAQNEIVVGVAGSSAPRRAGREPHDAEAQVERGVELDDRLLGFVEVADRDAVEPIVSVAEAGHRSVVRAVRAIPECRVIELEERRAERRVHDLMLEAEQVEPRLRSSGSTAPRAACHFGPRLTRSSPSPIKRSRSSLECCQ